MPTYALVIEVEFDAEDIVDADLQALSIRDRVAAFPDIDFAQINVPEDIDG